MTRRSLGRTRAVLALATVGVLLAACGSPGNFANQPRPAATLQITAAVAGSNVVVSPDQLGAGEIELIVANETGSSQQVTLQKTTPGAQPEQTAPINPGDLTKIDTVLTPGEYTLSTGDAAIHEARLKVGAERASAQNDLLQP
jgi:hypothetical protein